MKDIVLVFFVHRCLCRSQGAELLFPIILQLQDLDAHIFACSYLLVAVNSALLLSVDLSYVVSCNHVHRISGLVCCVYLLHFTHRYLGDFRRADDSSQCKTPQFWSPVSLSASTRAFAGPGMYSTAARDPGPAEEYNSKGGRICRRSRSYTWPSGSYFHRFCSFRGLLPPGPQV